MKITVYAEEEAEFEAWVQEQLAASGGVVTLTTCIGTFDQATGQYDPRLIVHAERATAGAAVVAQPKGASRVKHEC